MTRAPAATPFTPERYRSAHYEHGRIPYAPSLIRRVAEVTGLGSEHRVLDLGCGPGPLARGFAPLVREVVAIDPSPEMLSEARVLAGQGSNIRFVTGSSYEVDPVLGHFHLAVMGRSFHWMDRVDTLMRLDKTIESAGAVALFYDSAPSIPANAWRSCSTHPSLAWNALAWSNVVRSTSRRWSRREHAGHGGGDPRRARRRARGGGRNSCPGGVAPRSLT